MSSSGRIASSFRDPSGFIFEKDGILYRQINPVYLPEFEKLFSSGLYTELTDLGLLIPHEPVDFPADCEARIIRPERVAAISYPYEWCFSRLKDAALATLRIQRLALDRGMSLKDASAYNIQFRRGKPVLIDTLSFETYREGTPWVAYGQFCRHFLAPLLLMSYVDVRLNQMSREWIDGVPLDLAAKLLPWRTRLNPNIFAHIHLHGRAGTRTGNGPTRELRLAKSGLLSILAGLESLVGSLKWEPKGTVWADYYNDTNYTEASMAAKTEIVERYLGATPTPTSVWDLGANDGRFSMIAAKKGIPTIAWDMDAAAVEKCYRKVGDLELLPLVQDLANPSPAIGWALHERQSLIERGPADAVLALALLHHLAIGNNVPLPMIADFFAQIGRRLIVEFVPKEDSQVQRMLASREDVFTEYGMSQFESAFEPQFEVISRDPIPGTCRTLFLMRNRSLG